MVDAGVVVEVVGVGGEGGDGVASHDRLQLLHLHGRDLARVHDRLRPGAWTIRDIGIDLRQE